MGRRPPAETEDGDGLSGKQLCRKGSGGPGGQPVECEPGVCPGSGGGGYYEQMKSLSPSA